MDRLILIQEARAAGLTVIADGERLVVRGPRRLDALAGRLLSSKADVMAELRRLQQQTDGLGVDAAGGGKDEFLAVLMTGELPLLETIDIRDVQPCRQCGSLHPSWEDGKGNWHCGQCDPPNNKAAKLYKLAARLRRRYSASRTRIAQDAGSGAQGGGNEPKVTEGNDAAGRS